VVTLIFGRGWEGAQVFDGVQSKCCTGSGHPMEASGEPVPGGQWGVSVSAGEMRSESSNAGAPHMVTSKKLTPRPSWCDEARILGEMSTTVTVAL
jgi:hypothetical protein